jgi:hypothetical protein
VLLRDVLLAALQEAHSGSGGSEELLLSLTLGGVGDGVARAGLGVYTTGVHDEASPFVGRVPGCWNTCGAISYTLLVAVPLARFNAYLGDVLRKPCTMLE